MTQHDARNQMEHRNNQTDILLGCSVGVSQAGLALTHNVLHLVVAVRIPVMFVLSMSKDISSGNADGLPQSGGNVPDNLGSRSSRSVRAWKPLLPHSGGNMPDNMGSCSCRAVRAWKPLLPHSAGSVPTIDKSSSHSSASSENAGGLPHSGGNVPDNMGSCSFSSVRAWKPLLPHSGGNVPYTMGSCSTRSAKLGSHCCPTMQVAFQQQVSQAATVLKAQ